MGIIWKIVVTNERYLPWSGFQGKVYAKTNKRNLSLIHSRFF